MDNSPDVESAVDFPAVADASDRPHGLRPRQMQRAGARHLASRPGSPLLQNEVRPDDKEYTVELTA